MKKPKSAVVTREKITSYIYSVTCPHCKTYLRGGFNEEHSRIQCRNCKNEIILNHE